MKKRDRKIVSKRKKKIAARLDRENNDFGGKPVFQARNMDYEMSARITGTTRGGVGAIHTMLHRLDFSTEINDALRLLKIHNPYFESDHILNLAYNVLTGGTRIEDIESLRQDAGYMDAIGAGRIPDPTTAGDFLRRFSEPQIEILMTTINKIRQKVWEECAKGDPSFYDEAILEVDGTLTETLGECKHGMDISYKGVWGYAPLIVTLANTREVLFIVNRPGNTPSAKDAAKWINRSIALLQGRFRRIVVRGDTDFSLTAYMDQWDEDGVRFVFGYDATPNLQAHAEGLSEARWEEFLRKEKYSVKTRSRARPHNVKEEIVRRRKFENQRLLCEDIQEFEYSPVKCDKTYRMVVIRKNISVEKGEHVMFEEFRYFFYITNDWTTPARDIVYEANQRCDQENIIGQLKSGINALRMPVDNLLSNWAYMVVASLAWNFKAWYGLLIPDDADSREVVRMEYKKFLVNFIQIPTQILRTGRRIVYRILGYNSYLPTFFDTFARIRRTKFG